MELIDRGKLKIAFCNAFCFGEFCQKGTCTVIEVLDKAQAVDAVPLEEYERVCKERDAAIDTLRYLAFEQNASVHKFCKNWTNHGCCCYDEHGNIIHECPGWEWEGVNGAN